MLRDPYGRKVDYLRVSVTDRCDLRCVYCMPPEGIPLKPVSEILTYDELIRTVRVAVSLGVRKVRITGGEPLVRRGIVSFVRRVAGIPAPDLEFQCTMRLARRIWKIRPTNLPAVCRHFQIPLKHHDAASDTEACAKIMIEALKAFQVS